MKRRHQGILAVATAAVAVVPLGVTATTAAWNDAEWVHASPIGTSTFDCGAQEGFASAASGRFLSGELLGLDLDSVAELTPMALSLQGDGALAVSPPDAIDLGATPPTYSYANPLDIDVLGGLVGLDLTGLQVGLPLGSAGAVNQYASVSATGTAAGASGLVTDSGGVLVTGDTPDADLPEPAAISLDDLLPGLAGLADVELQVGAVAASSVLDGCAALRSALWGDGTVTGVTRDYGIAGLGLQLNSPLVGDLIESVNGAVTQLTAAVDALTGSSGAISNAIGTQIDLAVPGVLTTSIGGTVSISGIDLADAVDSLLTTPLGDGVVSIDLDSGDIDVDLDALLPELNDAAPNTEIVLNSDVLNPIVTRVGTLLDTLTTQITEALLSELDAAQVAIDLSAVIRAPGVPIVAPAGIDILDVSVDFDGTLGGLRAPGATLAVDAEVLGLVSLVDTVLSTLGLPTLTTILNTVLGLGTTLATSVVGTVTTTVLPLVTTLGGMLGAVVDSLLTTLDGLVDALPTVVSLMVNVQPDQAGAPPGTAFEAGTRSSTPQYLVSALRIGLADFLVPDDVLHISLATASAGPVRAP